MKLSDWGILFGMLFLCVSVPQELKQYYLQQAQFTTEEYNRAIDRAAWDCLMDTVEEERADGSLRINGKMAEQHFYEQLYFVFDATSEREKRVLASGVKLFQVLNENDALSMEETDKIRSEMEQSVKEQYESDAQLFAFYFPYIGEEKWYQELKKQGVYIFYDVPEGEGMYYNRYLFSGSTIKKSSP